MNSLIKETLTRIESPTGKPLFRTGKELSKKIIELSDSPYSNEESLYGFVMQVFRNERPCSDDLKTWILAAAKDQLNAVDDSVQARWIKEVERAIELQNAKRDETKPLEAERLFEEMIQRAEQAREHFIITSKTAEEEMSQKRKAKTLNEILIRRLGLFKESEISSPDTRYIFCVPSYEAAERFWHRLFITITSSDIPTGSKHSAEEASKKIQLLNEQAFLQVWLVPTIMCGCAIVVFDPDDSDKTAAFSFCYHSSDRASVLKWDTESVTWWKTHVRAPFYLFLDQTEISRMLDNSQDSVLRKVIKGTLERFKRKQCLWNEMPFQIQPISERK